jgi:hypothetical protein
LTELIIFANNRARGEPFKEFTSKAVMYVSWLESEDLKGKILQRLKLGLTDYWKFIQEFNISIEGQ